MTDKEKVTAAAEFSLDLMKAAEKAREAGVDPVRAASIAKDFASDLHDIAAKPSDDPAPSPDRKERT